eukprot:gene35559-43842_t
MADTPALFDTRLVALDWGTSSLRAFRLDGKGQVQEQRHRPWGIMNLPQAPDGHTDAEPRTEPGAAFERALQDTCGDWLTALPSVPVLACGMVGSAQGWREAKYLDAPTSLDALARGLTVVHRGNAMPVQIVPGLLQRGALPNVMRGEETQVLGCPRRSATAGCRWRQGEQLRMAEQAMLQVTDMVNLSTELYKIETGKYRLRAEPLPISDVLRRVVETARASYAGKQLVIAVDTDFDVGTDPPMGLGDAMLTYSLLHNLVKNACEAAPERSRVSATLYADSPLRIEIVNKGVIPEPIRERFFDKFVTDGKAGGTGLGTYSARLLARAQLGEVVAPR